MSNAFKAFGSAMKKHTDNLTDTVNASIAQMQTPSAEAATPVPGSGTEGGGKKASGETRNPADIPKDELITLMVKMSKKVKTLQANKSQIESRIQKQNQNYSNLLSFVGEEVVPGLSSTLAEEEESAKTSGTTVDRLAARCVSPAQLR